MTMESGSVNAKGMRGSFDSLTLCSAALRPCTVPVSLRTSNAGRKYAAVDVLLSSSKMLCTIVSACVLMSALA